MESSNGMRSQRFSPESDPSNSVGGKLDGENKKGWSAGAILRNLVSNFCRWCHAPSLLPYRVRSEWTAKQSFLFGAALGWATTAIVAVLLGLLLRFLNLHCQLL